MKFDVEGRATYIPGEPEEEISVYPNPASDRLSVRLPVDSFDAEMSLYTVNGKLVRRKILEPGSELHQMDLSDISSGYYILRVSDRDSIYTGKISVIK